MHGRRYCMLSIYRIVASVLHCCIHNTHTHTSVLTIRSSLSIMCLFGILYSTIECNALAWLANDKMHVNRMCDVHAWIWATAMIGIRAHQCCTSHAARIPDTSATPKMRYKESMPRTLVHDNLNTIAHIRMVCRVVCACAVRSWLVANWHRIKIKKIISTQLFDTFALCASAYDGVCCVRGRIYCDVSEGESVHIELSHTLRLIPERKMNVFEGKDTRAEKNKCDWCDVLGDGKRSDNYRIVAIPCKYDTGDYSIFFFCIPAAYNLFHHW